jgi:glyoxylase-like metal-dependent hydrolase (beta-lactamase superfamily II)
MLVIHTPGHTEGCVSLFFDSSSNISNSSSNTVNSSNTDNSSSSSSSTSSSTSSSSSSSSEDDSTTAASSKGEGVLFTGDHLAYSQSRSALTGFPGYNRAGLFKQADSIAILAGSSSSSSKSDAPNWLWVLPGHGRSASFSSAAERSAAVRAAADALRADAQRLRRH